MSAVTRGTLPPCLYKERRGIQLFYMGELWERSQKAPYEKVGNYKYLQVFIQVPSTVHWWNMAWMQRGVRGKKIWCKCYWFHFTGTDINSVHLSWLTLVLSQNLHVHSCHMNRWQIFFSKIKSCWRKDIIKRIYFWVIRNTWSSLFPQRWVDVRLFREMASAILLLSPCKLLVAVDTASGGSSPTTTTGLHH